MQTIKNIGGLVWKKIASKQQQKTDLVPRTHFP